MTVPANQNSPHAPEVVLTDLVACTGGGEVQVPVLVRHRGPTPALLTLTVLGLDSTWVPEPLVVGPVEPGGMVEVSLTLMPERGALGARYPFVVAAEALSDGSEKPVLGIAESVLAVDARERIVLAVVPDTVTAVFGKRVELQISNPGRTDRELDLEASDAGGASLRLKADSVLVPAGRTAVVKGKVKVRRPRVFGFAGVHTVGVTARGTGAPEFVEATVRARPFIKGAVGAAVAIGLVLALWAAAAIVFIPKLSEQFTAKNSAVPTTETTSATASGSGAPGTGGADGGTGGDGSGGTGGDGGPGGDGDTGGTGGEDGAGGEDDGAATGDTRLVGSVVGPGADGATVTIESTSLSAAAETGAEPTPGTDPEDPVAQGLRSATEAIGKIQEPAPAATGGAAEATYKRAECSQTYKTTDDGAFAFGCLSDPGYYLLSISGPGFQTQKYVVDASTVGDADPLEVDLAAAAGSMSGTVTGPNGPVGAATVEITDGTVSLSTSSVTAESAAQADPVAVGTTGAAATGEPGSWTVSGLSTPGSYLVTVSAAGFGTASTLVEVDAGGAATADLTLKRGVALITGTVTGTDELGVSGGLGGITVTASDGETTRTATTVTTGSVGSYALPDLPAPGDYTLTVTGTGFSTQTSVVTLPEDLGEVVADVSLTRVNGSVSGTVRSGGAGLDGVGLTLTGKDAAYKTMSLSDPLGGFGFTGVVPGTYVLTGEMFGRTPQAVTVEVTAGATVQADLTLPTDSGTALPYTAQVAGAVVDDRSGGALVCDRKLVTDTAKCVVSVSGVVPIPPPGSGKTESTTAVGSDVGYTWPDEPVLPPGMYDLTLSAPGFENATIRVAVAQGPGRTTAPEVRLQPLGLITGTVSARVGRPASPSCAVALAATGDAPTSCTISGAGTDNPTCKAAASAVLCTVVGSDGKYQLIGLTQGAYRVTAIPTDPEYLPTTPVTVRLDFGDDAVVNGVLDRLGRLEVTVLTPDLGTAALRPAAGATVRLTPEEGAPVARPASGKTNVDGVFATTGLRGNYRVTASGGGGSASVSSGAIALNQTAAVTAVLTAPIGIVVGVVSTTVEGATVPVSGAVVSIEGITGFTGSTPVIGAVELTADDNGCFAVVPAGWTGPAPTGPGCETIDASAIGPVTRGSTEVSLVALPVDISVARADSRTEAYLAAGVLISDPRVDNPDPAKQIRDLPAILLTAQPSAFGTHDLVVAPTGAELDKASLIFSVTKQPAGSGAITVSLAPDGRLVLRDASRPTDNIATPGSYTVEVTARGFAATSFDISCELGTECRLTQNGVGTADVTLKRLPTMTGTITLTRPIAGVEVIDTRITPVSVPTTAGAVTASVIEGGVVSFHDANQNCSSPVPAPGRPCSLAVAGTYVFDLALRGYATKRITIACGADYSFDPPAGGYVQGCQPLSAALDRLPIFDGQLQLSPARLPGAVDDVPPDSAKIEIVAQPSPSIVASVTISTTGRLSWVDTAQPAGIIAPGDYTLRISRPGYATSTVTFSCSAAAVICTPQGEITGGAPAPTVVQMLPRGSGTVAVSAAPPDVGGAAQATPFDSAIITLTNQPGGTSRLKLSLLQTGPTTATLVWDDADVGIIGLTQPGTYAMTIEVPGYFPSGSVTFNCTVGAVCTGTIPTLQRRPVFTGAAVRQPGGASGMTGAQFAVTGAGASVLLTSVDNGTLTWQDRAAGWPANLVRNGTYQITGALAGYDSEPGTMTCPQTGGGTGDAAVCTLQLAFTANSQLHVVTQDFAGNPVNGGRFILTGNRIAQETVNAPINSNTVTFRSSPAVPSATYQLSVLAPGFALRQTDGNDTFVTCTNGDQTATGLRLLPGGTTTCTVKLQPLGTIDGHTVTRMVLTDPDPDRVVDDALPGATVIACQVATETATTCPSGAARFDAVSDVGGDLKITGTSTEAGLLDSTWLLSATGPGAEPIAGTVVITRVPGNPGTPGTPGIPGTPGTGATANSYALELSAAGGGRFEVADVDLDGDGAPDVRRALIPLPRTKVTLQAFTKSTFGAPMLPAGTYTLAGANGSATCVVPATDAVACANRATAPFVTFVGMYPGSYTLTAAPPLLDEDGQPVTQPEFTESSQGVEILPAVTVALRTQRVDFPLSSRLNTQRIEVSRVDDDGAESWVAGSVVSILDANTREVADDFAGQPLTGPLTQSPAGSQTGAAVTFGNVLDSPSYMVQVSVPGYQPVESGVIVMLARAGPPPTLRYALVPATRQLNLTLGSTALASSGGGPPTTASLAGATVELRQKKTIGAAPPFTDPVVAVVGSNGLVSVPALRTGKWEAAVTSGQTGGGLNLGTPFQSMTTEFDVLDPTFTDTAAVAVSRVVAQAQARLQITWPNTSCTVADGPSGSIAIELVRTGATPSTMTLTAPIQPGTTTITAAVSTFLPPGSYTWTTTGLPEGWGDASGAFTVTVPTGAAVGSVSPIASSDTATPATVPAAVSMTIDGGPAPGIVQVTATQDDADDVPGQLSGGTGELCVAPGEWTFSVASEAILLADHDDVTIGASGGTVPAFQGFSLTATAALTSVAGRANDSRTVTVVIENDGDEVWRASPNPQLSSASGYTGPTLVVPAGDYGLTVTPPTADAFGPDTAGPIDVATAHELDATLPYRLAMFTVTVTQDDVPLAGATVTVSGVPGTRTSDVNGQVLYADLAPGSHTVTATAGARTGTVTGHPVPVGVSGLTVPLAPAGGGGGGGGGGGAGGAGARGVPGGGDSGDDGEPTVPSSAPLPVSTAPATTKPVSPPTVPSTPTSAATPTKAPTTAASTPAPITTAATTTTTTTAAEAPATESSQAAEFVDPGEESGTG